MAGGKSSPPVPAGLGEPTGVELRGGGGAACREWDQLHNGGEVRSEEEEETDGGETLAPSWRGGYGSEPACMSLAISLGESRTEPESIESSRVAAHTLAHDAPLGEFLPGAGLESLALA